METRTDNIFIKLSDNSNIEKLYKKFGMNLLEDINASIDEFEVYESWNRFHLLGSNTFSNLYLSFLEPYLLEIRNQLQKYDDNFQSDTIERTITENMLENISSLSEGVWIAEMRNINKNQTEYLVYLNQDYKNLAEVVKKYPYWYFSIISFIRDTTKYLLEFLSHLIQDKALVANQFLEADGMITDIKLSMGDRHRGTFVIKVESKFGNYFYKPRRSKLDTLFKEVIDKIGEQDGILKMKAPKIIDQGSYSWAEEIRYIPLQSRNKNERYYIRLGQLLAITYILNGSDLHYENIISCGEFPVAIDVETLLTSRLRFKKQTTPKMLQEDNINYLEDSVSNLIILPTIVKSNGDFYDLSPLKIYSGELPNTLAETWKKSNHLIQKNELKDVIGFIQRGFINIYNEVLKDKERYKEYFNRLFNNVPIRYLNREIHDYSQILRLLKNPVCLFHFKYAFAVSMKLLSEEIQEEEVLEYKELLKFNIPYFELDTDSTDLLLFDDKRIKNYFIETPLESLEHKLNILCEEDLERQLRLITQMLTVVSAEFDVKEINEVTIHEGESLQKQRAQTVEQMIATVFENKLINPLTKQYFWITPELEGDNNRSFYQIHENPDSYYSGSVGILRCLLLLEKSGYKDLPINKLISDIEIDIDAIINYGTADTSIGAYNGIAQYLRYYAYIYKNNNFSVLSLKRIHYLLDLIENGFKNDEKLDILDGTAGVILTLIEIFQLDLSDCLNNRVIKLVEKCRLHLIDSIIYDKGEAYFPIAQEKNRYFTGFAHGSSGITLAIYRASKLLNIDDYTLIRSLLKTERRLFDKTNQMWFKDNNRNSYSWGWCHGIPGILLSRLELIKHGYQDDYIIEEAYELYEIAIKKSLGVNLTFCHGDLGNIVICKYAEVMLDIENSKVDKYIQEIFPYLTNATRYHIRGTETIGVMHGLVGVATFLDSTICDNYLRFLDILKITSD